MPEAANPSGAPPAATPDPKNASPRRIKGTLIGIGGLLTAIGAIATVLALGITVHDRPHAPTKAAWLSHANAVCDRDGGNLRSDIGDAATEMEAAMTGLATLQQGGVGTDSVSIFANDLAGTSAVLLRVGGGFRIVIGDLRALPAPSQLAPDISHALDQGDKAASDFDQLGSGMLTILTTLNQGLRDPSEMQQETNSAASQMPKLTVILATLSKDLQDWHSESRALGTTECP